MAVDNERSKRETHRCKKSRQPAGTIRNRTTPGRCLDLEDIAETNIRNRITRLFADEGYTTAIVDRRTMASGVAKDITHIIMRVSWDEIGIALKTAIGEARVASVIATVDASRVTPSKIEGIIAHRFYARQIAMYVEVLFGSEVPTPEELDNWFSVFRGLPIDGLVFDSYETLLDDDHSNAYIPVVLAHKELIEQTKTQIRFLKAFRPAHCSYLDMKRPIAVVRGKHMTICPRHKPTVGMAGGLHAALDATASRAGALQKIRLAHYAWTGTPFTCAACVEEGSKL